MTSKQDSLDYELETRLRNRLFDATEKKLKKSLFEVLSKSYSDTLYNSTTLNFHNPLWNNLKHEEIINKGYYN
jgi:hypothetical protein